MVLDERKTLGSGSGFAEGPFIGVDDCVLALEFFFCGVKIPFCIAFVSSLPASKSIWRYNQRLACDFPCHSPW